MRSPRGIAAGIFVIGLIVGTIADSRATRISRPDEGYWILAADFHVHAFAGDGALPPWSLRREAERAGLDVFAITNHNQVFTARIGGWLSRRSAGPLVLVGEEITGRNYHLIAVGIERAIDWDQSALAAVSAVHAQGGIAIAAHPVRRYWNAFDERVLALLDGVEAAHPAIHADEISRREIEAFYHRAREQKKTLAAIGSSDFHAIAPIGMCRTYVLARENTEAGVIDAVRHGRTVAVDAHGNAYGDPEDVRRIVAHRARNAQPASSSASPWRRFAVTFVWLGLLGMVILNNAPFRSARG